MILLYYFLDFLTQLCHSIFMNKILKKVKIVVQKLRDFFPSPLPRGMQEFETWSQAIVDTYGFPDNDSVRFMLAAMIMHLGQTDANKPRRFFALSGLAAASKEIAHAKMVILKEAQEQKAKAEVTGAAAAPNVSST